MITRSATAAVAPGRTGAGSGRSPRRLEPAIANVRRGASALVLGLTMALLAGCGTSGPGDEIATPPSVGFTPSTDPTTPGTGPPPPDTSAPVPTTSAAGKATLSGSSTISTVGLDQVHFGMTVAEAEAAAGTQLVTEGTRDTSCFVASPAVGPAGIAFGFSDGTVERVDITAPPIATRSGATVGTTEAQVMALYGDQIEVQPRADSQPGNALVFVPRDEADKDFRLIFTTDGATVTSYRAGRVPRVLTATGCS